MKNQATQLKQKILLCILAFSIPIFLAVDSFQTRKYAKLDQEVTNLERRQRDLVDQNKKLIADISLLSNSTRIEKLAAEKYGMRKARSSEIVRVSVKSDSSK